MKLEGIVLDCLQVWRRFISAPKVWIYHWLPRCCFCMSFYTWPAVVCPRQATPTKGGVFMCHVFYLEAKKLVVFKLNLFTSVDLQAVDSRTGVPLRPDCSDRDSWHGRFARHNTKLSSLTRLSATHGTPGNSSTRADRLVRTRNKQQILKTICVVIVLQFMVSLGLFRT